MTLRPAQPSPVTEEPATAPPSKSLPTTWRTRRRRSRGIDPIPWWLKLVVLVAVYLILPTVFVIPMSFGSTRSFAFPPKDLPFDLYHNFFTDPRWLSSLRNSVVVGVLAALIATVVGTAAAVGLHHLRGKPAQIMRALLMVPLLAPGIVVAVAVYVSLLKWHLVGTLQGYVLPTQPSPSPSSWWP